MNLSSARIAVCAALLALAPGGCAPLEKPPLPEKPDSDVPWTYEPEGVVLRINAVPGLNEYEGEPSSLMLCVYQLSSREGLDMRLASREGFAELLACKRFDDSVATAQRLFSDPGQAQNLYLDRQEGVRWIALVAGYYHGTPARSALVVPVPIRTVTEGWMPFMKKTHREPGRTILPIRLGASEILGR